MKYWIALLATVPSFAYAASDVTVTSFRFLEQSGRFSPTAELCGETKVPTGKPQMIKITSDPNSKGPALYYVWAGPEGKFCAVIATFTGNANAEIQN